MILKKKHGHVSIHLMLQFILHTTLYLCEIFCFNTSHVVVYRETNAEIFGELEFQYISCCSLSSCRPFFDQSRLCFNTSHVVVYRIKEGQCLLVVEFQYISCCSLSIYCRKSKNLYVCFNTSHVVVYLLRSNCFKVSTSVSIHLMLQFISQRKGANLSHTSVSIHLMLQFIETGRTMKGWLILVSIHLMLQFIQQTVN